MGMKALIVAMGKEALPIQQRSQLIEEKTFGFAKFEKRSYHGVEFLLAITGIGKVFAGAATQAIVDHYPEVDSILNVGVSGSIDFEKAPLFTIVYGTSFVQHDMDTSPIGDPVGMISGINVVSFEADPKILESLRNLNGNAVKGRVLSGDRFVAESEHKKALAKAWDAITIDMESAAEAQIAYVNKIPFGSLKCISDAGNAAEEYEQNAKKAADFLGGLALLYLSE